MLGTICLIGKTATPLGVEAMWRRIRGWEQLKSPMMTKDLSGNDATVRMVIPSTKKQSRSSEVPLSSLSLHSIPSAFVSPTTQLENPPSSGPQRHTIAMSPLKQQRLLWVHSAEPTGVRRRDKATMTKIRRHIMKDIGISRRKPQQNPQFVIEMGSPRMDSLVPPFWSQDPLSLLEQEWGMDSFSAYGMCFLAAEGKRLLGNADALTSEGFSFPFAFTSSAFLRHFKPIFSDPSVLKGIYHRSSARIRVMALERSMGTISCIEANVAKPSFDLATADRVIYAVLSVICYNVSGAHGLYRYFLLPEPLMIVPQAVEPRV